MRTISATVSTREEAEAARRRLEALGIDSDRILLKEIGEPEAGGGGAGEPSIFVTAKVTPEQAGAAADILKGGAAQAGQPLPHRDSDNPGIETRAGVPQQSQGRRVDAAPSPPAAPAGDRGTGTARMEPPAQSAPTGERSAHKTAPPPSVARMAAIALLLAGLGFAVGAALGIVV